MRARKRSSEFFDARRPRTEHYEYMIGHDDMSESNLIDVRLSAVRYAASEINIYEFSPLRGVALPAAEPGAHVDLHLPNGLIRQYSIAEPGSNPSRYVTAIKRDAASRGGSQYIFDKLKVGDLLKLGAPVNNFALHDGVEHSVLIAGGIGITPIWAMAQQLRAQNRSWELHYSARSKADMAFIDDIKMALPAKLHFDDEAQGAFLDLRSIVSHAPEHAHLYCCGPNQMLSTFDEVTATWPADQIHVEHFAAKEQADLKGGYVVELVRDGRTFNIPPGKSILAVLREAGINVPFSCEDGVCGACETTVLSGTPDHRDSVLSKKEREANKSMMICCSGSQGDRLVLDL